MRHLPDVNPETLAQLQHLSHSLVNKLLHEPTLHLRSKGQEEEAAVYAETVRELFGLQPATSNQEPVFSIQYSVVGGQAIVNRES